MNRSHETFERQRIVRRGLLALVPLLLLLEIPGVVGLLRRPDLGWKLRQTTVMVVEPGGPAARAGVEVGDRVLALGRERVASYADLRAALSGHGSGGHATLTLIRDDNPVALDVELAARPIESQVLTLSMRLSAICVLFLGFITYLRRNDELGRVFHVTCLLLALPFLDLPGVADPTWMRLVTGLRDGLQALLPAFLLRFLLIFPEGSTGSGEYSRQRWILLPALVLLPLHLVSSLTPGGRGAQTVETLLLTATTLLFAGYVVAAVVVFARKVRGREAWIRGSKLRLAALGILAGVLPLTVAAVARLVAPTHGLPLDEVAVLALPLVPASFSLALLRTGAIDLAYLTRQALVAVFLALPLGVAAWVLAGLVAPRVDPAARPIIHLGITLLAFVAVTVARAPARALARGIDHVLYPEQRRVRRVAERLGRELSELKQPDEVIEHFLGAMRELVGTPDARLLEPSAERWVDPRRDGDDHGEPSLPADSSLTRLLVRSREVVVLEPDEVFDDERFGPATRGWILRTDAHVVAPLVASGEAIAILVLGRREADRDYGALHLYHVDHLCRQAAAALQNARLHQEDLARERVRTELQLAQTIQQQLLPQRPHESGQLQAFGRTVSSRSVGGDLHDHFTLSDGSLVVVVADTSGKGIPASLLTSGLRTAVRETVRPDLALDEAMCHVNRHVHGMTGTGHFIALFCALVRPADGLVDYCVAGIEPPLWVRPKLGRIEFLTRGGPVLGVDPDARFRVGTIRLEPGDTLVAYTDGVTDEEDADGEPFGLQKLTELVRALGDAPPRQVLEGIFEAVQGHAGGEAVDDTTALVLRRPEEVRIGTKRAEPSLRPRVGMGGDVGLTQSS